MSNSGHENLSMHYWDFALIDIDAQGGYARVARAYSAALNREVAFKVLRTSPEVLRFGIKRFVAEVQLLHDLGPVRVRQLGGTFTIHDREQVARQ